MGSHAGRDQPCDNQPDAARGSTMSLSFRLHRMMHGQVSLSLSHSWICLSINRLPGAPTVSFASELQAISVSHARADLLGSSAPSFTPAGALIARGKPYPRRWSVRCRPE